MLVPSHSIRSNLAAGIAFAALFLVVPTTAQSDLGSRLRPITGKVKDAGTLHLATGQWTRAHGRQALLGASDLIVYSNTCDALYYAGQSALGNEVWTDEGAIPDQGQSTVPSTLIPGSNDADTGCAATYNITGFHTGYCTHQSVFTANVNFYDNYEPVGTPCAIPGTPAASFALTGLPASPTVGVQACWLVTFDIAGAGNFTLTGTGTNPNLFGWSFAVTSPGSAANPDGPFVGGAPASCSGTDATRWDRGTSNLPNFPGNYVPGPVLPSALEEGTGMLTLDAIRVDGPNPGCFFFMGNPLASLYIELYSDVDPCQVLVETASFCTSNASCPCGLVSPNTGTGCDNESGTGGAVLTATGNSSVSTDLSAPAVFLTLSNAPPFKTSVFIQGTTVVSALPFGDGLRCVGGSLVRLNAPPPPPPPGDPTDASGSLTYPTASHPLSITARSQQAGQPISPGTTRHYFAQYRDPAPNNCNVSLGGTVNTSQALTITWGP